MKMYTFIGGKMMKIDAFRVFLPILCDNKGMVDLNDLYKWFDENRGSIIGA